MGCLAKGELFDLSKTVHQEKSEVDGSYLAVAHHRCQCIQKPLFIFGNVKEFKRTGEMSCE